MSNPTTIKRWINPGILDVHNIEKMEDVGAQLIDDLHGIFFETEDGSIYGCRVSIECVALDESTIKERGLRQL